MRYDLTDPGLKVGLSGPAALEVAPRPLKHVSRLPVLEVLSAIHFPDDITLAVGAVVHDCLSPHRGPPCVPLKAKSPSPPALPVGIGLEIAQRFVQAGSVAVIADLALAATQATAVEFEAEGHKAEVARRRFPRS